MSMFHKPVETVPTPQPDVAEPAAPPSVAQLPLIPLSELELDLPAPGEGWAAHLAHRGVEIVLDDIGRASVRRSDARLLFTERREQDEKARVHAAAVELRAVEADRLRRAQLGQGVPASAIPAGLTMAEAFRDAEIAAMGGFRPGRSSLIEDALDNSGMTFHSLAEDDQ